MAEINGPVRVGEATCMPGDIVLATPTGVIFVPPQYASEVVESSENTPPARLLGQKEHCRRPLHTRRGGSQVVA